jgi:hypothetical protein
MRQEQVTLHLTIDSSPTFPSLMCMCHVCQRLKQNVRTNQFVLLCVNEGTNGDEDPLSCIVGYDMSRTCGR